MLIAEQSSKVMVFSKESDFRYPSYPIKKYSFLNDSSVSNISSLGLSIPNGNNLLEVLQREPLLRKDLAEILQTYELKLLLDSSSGSIMLIKELGDSTVLRIPYHQIADTLKRLIFFKAAIQSNSDSVLLFEEPEAHMFPPYIAKFTTDVMYDKNNNQYFIATHSPFVLNDFMEDMEKDDLAIYAIGYLKGETTINRLTDKQVTDIYQYGVDLFFNLEEFLKDVVS
jgi:predicted ATP-dependent endonuclease of OLD family